MTAMHSPGSRDQRPRREGRGAYDHGGGEGPAIDYGALVAFIARAVAADPEAVEVEALDRGRGSVAVKIKMAEADVGKLIGRGGRNIEAVRALIRTASMREHRRVFVDLA